MSVMSIDGVTLCLRLKEVTSTHETVKLVAGFYQCNDRKMEEAEDFIHMDFSINLCLNRDQILEF